MMIRKNIINKIEFIVKSIRKIMINNEKCLNVKKIIIDYKWQDNRFWIMKQSFLTKNKRKISEIW